MEHQDTKDTKTPPLEHTERMANSLNLIDHIVVLMLENRSFDNMLGWQFGLDAKKFNVHRSGRARSTSGATRASTPGDDDSRSGSR